MVKKRKKFPEVGELVVAQAEQIERSYVYVRLEDYEGNEGPGGRAPGMIHISELANRWIRNISNFIKPNQRVVLKVLRVNPQRGHIDLSLRRVTEEQKIATLEQWKLNVKAENLLKFFAEKHGYSLDEAYDKIGWFLVDKYGDLRTGFEEIKEHGRAVLDDPAIKLSDEEKDDFFKLIDQNIQLHHVQIDGRFEIICYEGNGINVIKNALLKSMELKKDKSITVQFNYIGAPKYAIRITALDYKAAERHLKKIIDTVKKELKPYDHEFEFIRTD